MLLSYIIIALSASFTSLVSGHPMGSLDELAARSPEPATLLGRHYQERSEPLTPTDAPSVASSDEHPTNLPRRLVPFPKYVADRSEDSWARMRERRADAASMGINYLSNVGPYSPPRPYNPPNPPAAVPPPAPPVTVRPPPTVTPPNIPVPPAPISTGRYAGNRTAEKNGQMKHTSKTKKTQAKKKVQRVARREAAVPRLG
ncbi:hypothetical protein BD413DRAFT_31921 [Trametes elegans]|nr:hypothetical protein BD413DRAFT_31921 [Trametes elegans]